MSDLDMIGGFAQLIEMYQPPTIEWQSGFIFILALCAL